MILLWAVLTLIPWCKQKINADVRLIVAALASLMVGISKELMDGFYDQWPWCSDDCYFDFWDLFVWIDGLLAGSVIVIIVIILQARYAPTPEIPCDDTEISMSVDEGSEINTDNDNGSSSIEKMHSSIEEEVLRMVEANSTSDPSNSDTVDPSFSTDDSPDIGEMPSNEINAVIESQDTVIISPTPTSVPSGKNPNELIISTTDIESQHLEEEKE